MLSNVPAPVTSTVPAKSTFAAAKVAAVVVPDLITRFPPLLFSDPNVALPSCSTMLAPSAFR